MNNKKNMPAGLDASVKPLLASGGVELSATMDNQLARYEALVRHWNPVAGLVSMGDAEAGLWGHVQDALSLAPFLRRLGYGYHLDIGSGGGFPAIPLAVVQPTVQFTLIERNQRKCGFLTKAKSALGLTNVHIEHGAFPTSSRPNGPCTITARAVERPEMLHPLIADWMEPGDVFLCQTGSVAAFPATMFHVEHIDDPWQSQGLRRGSLAIVTR